MILDFCFFKKRIPRTVVGNVYYSFKDNNVSCSLAMNVAIGSGLNIFKADQNSL